MIDVHCHLNFHKFETDYDEVIKNASQAGVSKIINVGTKLDSSQWAVNLASQYENLYAIVGIHPHHSDKHELSSDWLSQLEFIAKSPKVVGIGEIGLDYFSYKSNGIVDPKLQEEVFRSQIELAHKLSLPLQIHNRQAGEDIIAILKNHSDLLQKVPGMFHCMSGNLDLLHEVLEMGFYVGFDGNITYDGLAPGEDTPLVDLVKKAPLDRIVIETDSPYLTPIPLRGQRNEPKNAILVGEFIAQTKGVSFDEVQTQTTKNVATLFNII